MDDRDGKSNRNKLFKTSELGFQISEISYIVVQLKSHNWSCNWSCHLSYVINICGANIGGHAFHLLQLVIARLIRTTNRGDCKLMELVGSNADWSYNQSGQFATARTTDRATA